MPLTTTKEYLLTGLYREKSEFKLHIYISHESSMNIEIYQSFNCVVLKTTL